VLQKRAIRSIAGLKAGTSTGAVFKSLNLLKLKNLYRHSAGTYVHKHRSRFGVHTKRRVGLKSGNVAASVPEWYKTRSCNQAAYAAATSYNSLLADLKGTVVVSTFCRDLRDFLLMLD